MSEPITYDNGDYGDKICRCCRCGCEELCTFEFDYYTAPEKDEQGRSLLLCERCLLLEHFGTAYPPKITIYPDGHKETEN